MPHNARFDTVFVQHGAHFIGRQINVCFAIVALHKTVAVTMAGNSAFEFGQQAGRGAGILMGRFDKNLFFELFSGISMPETGLTLRAEIRGN